MLEVTLVEIFTTAGLELLTTSAMASGPTPGSCSAVARPCKPGVLGTGKKSLKNWQPPANIIPATKAARAKNNIERLQFSNIP
ncbi:MAG: hypothetical protein BWY80_01426 [Firmicutes bacterium ADurb.Bin456]|nr:MAG: hypothetical protein BWY80_01426 [Firmicutes bacterium ADurb.Bin456]